MNKKRLLKSKSPVDEKKMHIRRNKFFLKIHLLFARKYDPTTRVLLFISYFPNRQNMVQMYHPDPDACLTVTDSYSDTTTS